MFLYRQSRPLEDDLLIAHIGLLGNPTIRSYTIDPNGQVVYEQVGSFQKLSEAMQEVCDVTEVVGGYLNHLWKTLRGKTIV